VSGFRESHAALRAFAAEEFVGQLKEDPRAISRVDFATGSPTVVQVLEGCEPIAHELMRALALKVDNETYSATVVL